MALVKAKFVVEEDSGPKTIPVHFNPSEYSIQSHSGLQKSEGTAVPQQIENVGVSDAETLTFTLYFDTYTRYWDSNDVALPLLALGRGDVRAYTEEIAALAKRSKASKPVSFIWGSLNFKGTVESVTQKFTMFLDDGKPVRAELNVTMRSTSALSALNFGIKTHSSIDLTNPAWKAITAGIVAAGKLRDALDGGL